MKKFIFAFTLLTLVASQASAFSLRVEEKEKAVNGIQTIEIGIRADKMEEISLLLAPNMNPLPKDMFKSNTVPDLGKFFVTGEKSFFVYFKVPKKGRFSYKICALSSGVVVTKEADLSVIICDDVLVDNK